MDFNARWCNKNRPRSSFHPMLLGPVPPLPPKFIEGTLTVWPSALSFRPKCPQTLECEHIACGQRGSLVTHLKDLKKCEDVGTLKKRGVNFDCIMMHPCGGGVMNILSSEARRTH